jgi:hypothetical protein
MLSPILLDDDATLDRSRDINIRIFRVPKKSLAFLNQDILHQIFESLFDIITPHYDLDWTQGFFQVDSVRSRHEAVTALCLTCREWSKVAQLYLPRELLGIKNIYPHLITYLNLRDRYLKFTDSRDRKFSMKAWIEGGQLFLDVLSRIPLGTSRLTFIYFDGCFNRFPPSKWAHSLRRCSDLRRFCFGGKSCVWDDIKDFLILFQTSSEVNLRLSLSEISMLRQHDMDATEVSRVDRKLKLDHLVIIGVSFLDISSNILPVVSLNLTGMILHGTAINIASARELLHFLFSAASTSLTLIVCSLMPPHLVEYLSSSQLDYSLIWPQSRKPQGIFISSTLTHFSFDGGVFGTATITPHEIALFSQVTTLQFLELKYCFQEIHPTIISSLANFNLWLSIRWLNFTFAFGDPNWEREPISQLSHQLGLTMDVEVSEEHGSQIMKINKREVAARRNVELRIREGGDQIDD